MVREWIKKNLPKDHTLKEHPRLQWLGSALHHPNLWYMNQQSSARGVAVGIFIACIPLPFQMLIAAIFAIFLQANLPIAVMITWINNPFTFIPINYFFYWVGALILREKEVKTTLSFAVDFKDWASLWDTVVLWLITMGKPYFLGLTLISTVLSAAGYLLVRICWKNQ